jgi:glycosyltransferase involved in cell wall biosynthesis
MKIGMLLETPFPTDLRVENEMRALAAAGHEIFLYCLKHHQATPDELFAPNIWLRRFFLSQKVYKKFRTTVLRAPFYAGMWRRFVSRYPRPDVLHVHDLPLARVAIALVQKWNIPFILDLHENYPAAIADWDLRQRVGGNFFYNAARWTQYEKDAVRAADQVIVVVEEARARVAGLGISPEKITVVSNTLNLAHDALPEPVSGQLAGDTLTLVYVGGLGKHRGVTTAIEGVAELTGKNIPVRLKVVGSGQDLPQLKKFAAERNVSDRVIFTGWLPLAEAFQQILESDICLVPYLSTGHTETTIPHKLFQYMYLKKPVMVSSCRPLVRIVEETGAGVVFKAGDPHDFAKATLELLDRDYRKQLGENGHQAVCHKYNWNADQQRLINFYHQLS